MPIHRLMPTQRLMPALGRVLADALTEAFAAR